MHVSYTNVCRKDVSIIYDYMCVDVALLHCLSASCAKGASSPSQSTSTSRAGQVTKVYGVPVYNLHRPQTNS